MNTVAAPVNLHPLWQELVGVDISHAMRVFRQRGLGARVWNEHPHLGERSEQSLVPWERCAAGRGRLTTQ
jgi:hypothetical protein